MTPLDEVRRDALRRVVQREIEDIREAIQGLTSIFEVRLLRREIIVRKQGHSEPMQTRMVCARRQFHTHVPCAAAAPVQAVARVAAQQAANLQ